MRATLDLVLDAKPDLEIEGEMRGDMALSKRILDAAFPIPACIPRPIF